MFLSLRCILFPWKANTHTLCPYPTPTEYSGEQQASALSHRSYCLLAARPQSGTPWTQDGLGGEPVYDMPYSCLKPQTLCFALPVTLTCLQEGNCLSGNA